MKAILIICLSFASIISFAQNYTLPQGEYMDTTLVISPKCSPPYSIFYYQVKAKYPVSSETLLREAKDFMKEKGHTYTGSGYVTFRFYVDCEGTMSRIKVMQTDEDYKPARFQKDLVEELYQFAKKINKWPTGIEIQDIKNVNYIAFISFKIKNGEIINIIP
ncbi:hypothetical protein [Dyadobacter sp. 32]|uniref:hypothetical protein n=1 Tax=Dyadobacter sp. 32 TaxID=538966 RepID=UPI0011ECED64